MTEAFLQVPDDYETLREALASEITPAAIDKGLVLVPSAVTDAWSDIAAELSQAFELTQQAARAGGPVTYIVQAADLLGQLGAGRAMVACGLLSGARTLAFETRKQGIAANVLATEPASPPELVARWARRLLEAGGPSGEVVRLGAGHVGKALP
ncbi:MAG: hypothetical protein ACE5MI_00780 [Acidimicrobiia bacterium]